MTKKHYIALADAVKARINEIENSGDTFDVSTLDWLADFCADQNPRFNRERWLDYINGKCGPNGGAVK